jgi:hypothetical protein
MTKKEIESIPVMTFTKKIQKNYKIKKIHAKTLNLTEKCEQDDERTTSR